MADELTPDAAMKLLTRRYGADPKALLSVLCPLLVPIHTLDKHIFVAPGQKHSRATFTVQITEDNYGVLVRVQRDNYDGRLPTIKLAKSGSRRVASRELPV
jgi:hypothetical protein